MPYDRSAGVMTGLLRAMSRRTFVGRAAAGLCGFALLEGCGPRVHQGPVVLGRPADFPTGRTPLESFRITLVKEVRGDLQRFGAVSLVCTHQTCLLKPERGDGFRCPCHGSSFSPEGAVLQGPAVKPLPWFLLSRSEQGELVLHREPAAADWRLEIQL